VTILDEPEAALSTQNCLTFLAPVQQLVHDGSQRIVATHSPLILAYPDALIYECDEYGLQPIAYDDAEPVRLTRSFLGAQEQFLRNLLD
jgi:predicted ATPase